MANSEFYLFPLLPPELRLQIWHYALPATFPIGSAVFPYKKGCWEPRRLTPGDPEYDPMNDDLNLNLEFDHTLLDPLKSELPLLQVNHEARSVALEWTRKQNFQVQFNKHNPQLLLLRPFNADTDTIYVSRSQWHDFICEPMERPFEPDLLQRQLGCPGVPFSRLALDDWILRHEPDCLTELFYYYYTIETVFAVTGFRFEGHVDYAGDDVNNSNSGKANAQHWREVESTPVRGPTFYWDVGSHSFRWKDIVEGTELMEYPLWKTLNYIGERLTDTIAESRRQTFEVRPACLVIRYVYLGNYVNLDEQSWKTLTDLHYRTFWPLHYWVFWRRMCAECGVARRA